MSSTTPTTRGRAPRWVTVGTANREYQALRLEILVGPARGSYYVAADDVSHLAEESVQVFRIRTVRGEQIPAVAGFTYLSGSGWMVIVQLDDVHARVMLPVLQLLEHLAHSAANKPTTITAPLEEVYPAPSSLQAVQA